MRNNKEKAITIAALVIAVIGLSIGFAAFASTLNISTSASVTPADGNFIVKFSKVNNELNEEDVTPSTGTGDAADIDNTNASNPKIGTLSTTFTQPGQSVEYTFYVRNMGKYDAYLTNIRFNNASTGNSFKVCTATSDNPVSNANDMCQYITYRLTLEDSPSNKVLTSTSDFATTVGNSYYVAKSADPTTGTTNSKMVKVTITYEDGSPFADGAFTVNFGSVELVFASLAGYTPPAPPSDSNETVCLVVDSVTESGDTYGVITNYNESCGSSVSIPATAYVTESVLGDFNMNSCLDMFIGMMVSDPEDAEEVAEVTSQAQSMCTSYKSIYDNHQEDNENYSNIVNSFVDKEYSQTTTQVPVKKIGDGAFYTRGLTSVNFSNATNLNEIGYGAFYENSISTIDLSGATNLTTIKKDAFHNNFIPSVIIPYSVTTIESGAFMNNPLTTVVIGDNVNGSNITTIEKEAFYSNSLTSVTIYRSSTGVEFYNDAFGNYDISSSWHPVGQ